MIQRYISIGRRWLWLLIVASCLAGFTSYWAVKDTPVLYEATSRLIIGPGVDSSNPTVNSYRTAGTLMDIYADLGTTRPSLQTLIDTLDLDMNPDELSKLVSLKTNHETITLSVVVQNESPVLAVDIANAMANMIVLLSPAASDGFESQLTDKMQAQTVKIEADIANFEENIRQLTEKLEFTIDLSESELILRQIADERKSLSDANRTLSTLFEALRETKTNQVNIIELADNANATSSFIELIIAIGSVTGFVLGLVIVIGYEFIFDKVETAGDLLQLLDAPILGEIAKHKSVNKSGEGILAVQEFSDIAAEDYRMLGTKLLLSNSTKLPSSVLLSGIQGNEPTSEIAANLAVVLAQAGHRVAIVDADFHNPSIHTLFGIANYFGLTNIITSYPKEPELTPVGWCPGLSVITSGPDISSSSGPSAGRNPFSLLASPNMTNLLSDLENLVDIVIIAAAPVLTFADSLILASRSEGVILTACKRSTRRDKSKQAVMNLRAVGANVIGAVLANHKRTIIQNSNNKPTAQGEIEMKAISEQKNTPAPMPRLSHRHS